MHRTLVAALAAWSCAALGSCRPRAAAPPSLDAAHGATRVPAASAVDPPQAAPPSDGDAQFLVLTLAGELVLRTPQDGQGRVLAREVSRALYDAALELVWLEGAELRVVDLRRPERAPIVVVRDWPGTSSLSIKHPASYVASNETCDVGDTIDVTWDEHPRVYRVAEDSGDLPVVAGDWLGAELQRAPRELTPEPAFSLLHEQPFVQLPPGVGRCVEDPGECGRVVSFGSLGLQLVLAVTLRGDCWHPYCLFRDPASGAFSSPLAGERWKGDGNRPGPCGEYAFDRAGSSFLVGTRLCGPGGECRDVGGQTLGWRNPGPVVGAPSDGEMAPDSE
ncbi:MAG TPA: hypothetical protein VNN80_34505 [Polyangiaceae bacterium]|nr:hypothetical protein [Polyangiaceae bacterium]